jgi:hypothetical protein
MWFAFSYNNNPSRFYRIDHAQVVDNSDRILKLIIINCKLYANNCGLCLNPYLVRIKCGWCVANSECTTRDHCVSATDRGLYGMDSWLSETDGKYKTCPNPYVNSVMPTCGPVNGYTTVQINGVNLGHSLDDMKVVFKSDNGLNAVECQNLDQGYIKSLQIKCRLPAIQPSLNLSKNSKVYITLQNSTVVLNASQYGFIRPEIFEIQPKRVRVSGGTLIEITGVHLNCGTFRSILFNQTACQIVNLTSDHLVCKLTRFNKTGSVNMRFQMDGYLVEHDETMNVIADPKMISISRNRSILAGGLDFLVYSDSDLDNVEDAMILMTPYHEDFAYFNETIEKVSLLFLYIENLNHIGQCFSQMPKNFIKVKKGKNVSMHSYKS